MMTDMKREAEQFQGRVIFMTMYDDIDWAKKGTEKPVLRILLCFRSMLENSRKDIGRFLGLDQRGSGAELTFSNQMEKETMSLIL